MRFMPEAGNHTIFAGPGKSLRLAICGIIAFRPAFENWTKTGTDGDKTVTVAPDNIQAESVVYF